MNRVCKQGKSFQIGGNSMCKGSEIAYSENTLMMVEKAKGINYMRMPRCLRKSRLAGEGGR